MKRILSLLFLFCLFISASAQIRGNEIRVVVTPDHSDWTYKTGETATFLIQVYKAQCLLENAVIDYELGPEMYPESQKSGVTLKDGTLKVKGKMKSPGFYRCKAVAYVNGRKYEGLATAAFDPLKIQAVTGIPQDFMEFWNTSLQQARKVNLNPVMELMPERCTETVNVYHVSYQNIRPGSRTYGILTMPKKPGKYPALLRVPGAGIRPYYGDIETASKGAIVLEIGIHGIPVTNTDAYYNLLFNGALHDYWLMNLDDRDEFYYKRVFVGAVRGVDFLCSLPEYNGNALGVTGASQGGMLSLVTAALDKRVTFYACIHPAMCDHSASLHKQACGWPHYFYQQEKPDEKRVLVSQYYDGINFARQITVPGWFSFGYNDEVVAPTSMYAVYNTLKAQKEIRPYLETGHYWYQEQYDEWNGWLWKQMGIK